MGGGLAADGAGACKAPGYVYCVLAFGVGVFCVGVCEDDGLVGYIDIDDKFGEEFLKECVGEIGLSLQFMRISSPGFIVRTAWTY